MRRAQVSEVLKICLMSFLNNQEKYYILYYCICFIK